MADISSTERLVPFSRARALFILRCSMQAMGHKVLPVLSSTIELVVKTISAVVVVLVPAIGYLGVAMTKPVIWLLCALLLSVFYVTIGHQKQSEESNV